MDQRLVNDAMRLPGMGDLGAISAYERRVRVVPACGAGRRKEPVGSRNGSGRRQPQAGIKLVGADPERGTGRPGENLAPRGHDERAGDRGGYAPSQQLAATVSIGRPGAPAQCGRCRPPLAGAECEIWIGVGEVGHALLFDEIALARQEFHEALDDAKE